MSNVRMAVELPFAALTNLFGALKFKPSQKVLLSPLGLTHFTMFFFYNAWNCYNLGQRLLLEKFT